MSEAKVMLGYAEWDALRATLSERTEEAAILRAENARLREALAKYAMHTAGCLAFAQHSRHEACTCGLTAALTGGPHE